ncbi:unnamed protein product [Bursaphelenchus okinawaensis]|uniref:Uncharacterized protein n=1 Tax=Bursaphelenchus okinawaensis TaxID=465554 RepID=A0A811JVJ9_9BILA|nr:unnamed protein product [Bursaphelenchus okinawaensis]CAG9085719.1 unnamed protein product [Bursaphelenchus okinawaensis]
MHKIYDKLPPGRWPIIVKNLAYVEDICSLAMVNKYMYQMVGKDFKKECYENAIFRLELETWAYAFKQVPHRVIKPQYIGDDRSPSEISCCPFTGTIAIAVPLFHVILTHIDFTQDKFEFLDFTKYEQIRKIQLINRSKQLLLYTDITVVVYDMMTRETVQVYVYHAEESYNCGTVFQQNKLIDYHNQADFAVNCKDYREPIRIGNPYDYRRYMGYVNKKDEFVVMDVQTGIPRELCQLDEDSEGFWILDSIGYVVHSGKNFEIYSLETYEKVFEYEYSDDDTYEPLQFLSQDLIDHSNHERFLTYNNVKNIWVWANKKEKNSEETDYPLIKHFFEPFPLMRLYDYGDELVYLLNLNGSSFIKLFKRQCLQPPLCSIEKFIGIELMVDVTNIENIEPEEAVEKKARNKFMARLDVIKFIHDNMFDRQSPELPQPPQNRITRPPFREIKLKRPFVRR